MSRRAALISVQYEIYKLINQLVHAEDRRHCHLSELPEVLGLSVRDRVLAARGKLKPI